MEFARPRILVSSCLGFEECDFRGQKHKSLLVDELRKYADLTAICPEHAMGLGSPRQSIRIVLMDREQRLLQRETNLDLTDKLEAFSDRFIKSIKYLDGCIMKNRSPTCGVRDVKIYLGLSEDSPTKRGKGLFAGRIQEQFPFVLIEDEGRLTSQRIRDSFLTVVFTKAAFRKIKEDYDYEKLFAFHEKNSLLFKSYSKTRYEEMKKVLNKFHMDEESMLFHYESALNACLDRLPRISSHKTVILEVLGHLKKRLDQNEIEFFEGRLKHYEAERLPLSAITTLLKAYLVRFSDKELLNQSYFSPYPEELMSVHDTKK